MKNSLYYRHFLMCNHLANSVLGHQYQNFAKLLMDEENGRYMNSQMTGYFIVLDERLSHLMANDPEWMWDELDMEEIAKIQPEQLEADFETFCEGQLRIDWEDAE